MEYKELEDIAQKMYVVLFPNKEDHSESHRHLATVYIKQQLEIVWLNGENSGMKKAQQIIDL